tara:strand:+ start:213 stop:461 length:249 start_codon:yes stop_codon:yes gene_type:complete
MSRFQALVKRLIEKHISPNAQATGDVSSHKMRDEDWLLHPALSLTSKRAQEKNVRTPLELQRKWPITEGLDQQSLKNYLSKG